MKSLNLNLNLNGGVIWKRSHTQSSHPKDGCYPFLYTYGCGCIYFSRVHDACW